MLARVTGYWRGENQSRASTGPRLRPGHCAVDPKRIPYGSKILLPDGELLAVDTGPAVVRRTAARREGRTAAQRQAIVIDRFFESKKQATAWTNSHPPYIVVRVIRPDRDSRGNLIAWNPAPSAPGEGPANVAVRQSVSGPKPAPGVTNVGNAHAIRHRKDAPALAPPLDD